MTGIAGNILGAARRLVCMPINRMVNGIDPPVIVLVYHRVATLQSDPEMLAVTADNFRTQMRFVKDHVPVVRFEEDWTKARRPAVCVTFDDGYADNVMEALPILEDVGVPATFFVTTGHIGTEHEFWWHELERIILGKRAFQATFSLGERSWGTGSGMERRALYDGLVRLMNDATPGQRDAWLTQLRRWAGVEVIPGGLHRSMTVEELRLLAGSSVVTIGAHTVSHSRLAALAASEQEEEIVTSKRQLESWLGREVSVFSYPFGKRCDYTGETMALCRQAGFAKAAANFTGQVHRWTDPYQIPRHLVRNWPLDTFSEKLRGFWTR